MALGGIGEIGMNCYLYGLGPEGGRQWLMVDLGITFPEGENDPGVDVILPDLRFIEDEQASLAGLVLTHGHEDHIGAVIEHWPRLKVPIYATPFTAALLRSKLAEYGRGLKLPIKEVELNARFDVGPFSLELISVAHSIPESNALAVRTPLGLALHTGDWKIDPTPVIGAPTDGGRLTALGAEGVTAMICDSTNALREGRSPSELDVARSLAGIIKGAKRRVAVTIFASNVARIKAVADATRSAGRHLVVAGRAMHRMIEVAIATGYLPKNFKYHDQEHFSYLEPSEVVLLCTGSQGEPRAAVARIAEDEHPDIGLEKGDLVIFSSRTIPGNERVVGRIQNKLVDLGCELITDADALVHVTGHPRREELKEMYGWVRPRAAIPMHGEPRHLAEHAKLATRGGRAGGARPSATATSCGWRPTPAAGDRRGAGRPAVPRRTPAGAEPRTGRCASVARWRSPASSSSASPVGKGRAAGRPRGGAGRRADGRHQGAVDAGHRARCGGRHAAQHPAQPPQGCRRWCARRCVGRCARPWRTPGASGRSPRSC